VPGSCEDSNETLVSINGREFLDQQSDYELLGKVPVSWS
jgi:hypothetical protein